MSDPARTPERMDNTTNIRTAGRSAGFCSMQWLDAGWWDKSAMEYSYKLERNLRVAKLRLEGKSYAAIGRSEGVNGCRVKQIITDLMRRVERRQAWLKAQASNDKLTDSRP
jgi:hypothetical protein